MSPEPQHESALHAPSSDRGATLASRIRELGAISRGKLMAILIVLLVGIVAMYVIEPRIEPSVGQSADPQHEIFTPFLISNVGFFAFRDVHLQCVARSVEFDETDAAVKPQINNNVLHVTNVATPSLRPGEKIGVACSKGLENAPAVLQHADVDVNVCLKPYPLIDYISLVHFRYVGERQAGGQISWSELPPRRSSIPWLVVRGESDKAECEWAE